jgi:hypothetical protein
LAELTVAVQRAEAMGNMVSPDKLAGFQNVLEHVGKLLGEIGADRNQKETANKLAEISGKLANLVKGFAQRLEQQMKGQQGEADDGGEMAKTQAKIAGTILAAKVKAESTRESHAQKTAQRQVSFETKQQQEEQQHQLELRREVEKQQVEDVARGIETAANLRQTQMKAATKEGE